MNVDESHRDAWGQQRLRNPPAPARMRRGLVLLVHAREDGERGHRRDDLQQRRALKRAQPLPNSGADGNPAPNAAAKTSERLAAAMDTGDFHNPCRRTRVETSFTQSLQSAAQIRSEDAERQQIGHA